MAGETRSQLLASARLGDDGLRVSLELRVSRPYFALVRDSQGQPAQPWVHALEPDGALLWLGQIKVPDGLLTAIPMLPRGEAIDPAKPWARTIVLSNPLRENALARISEAETKRGVITKLLVGVQVAAPERPPLPDPKTGTIAVEFAERPLVAWAWATLPGDGVVAIERTVLPRPVPKSVVAMIDHALPAEYRRLQRTSA